MSRLSELSRKRHKPVSASTKWGSSHFLVKPHLFLNFQRVTFVTKRKTMRPSEFTVTIMKEFPELVSDSGAKGIMSALTKHGVLNGRKDHTPESAAAQLFAYLACPTTNFHRALMWVTDRSWEVKAYNRPEDSPIYALKQFLAMPEEIEKMQVSFFGFAPDGRLYIFRRGAVDILPKKILTESGEVVDSLEYPAQKGALIPAAAIYRIAKRLGFTPADLKAESSLLIDILGQ